MRAWPLEVLLVASGRWTGWAERLGVRVPVVQPGGIWIHGASLGELAIARRLADALPGAFCTCDTSAGRVRADAWRPFDHPWALAPLWSEARPRLLVFVEGSWWPALAALAREQGVPIAIVAARTHARKRLMHSWLGWPDLVLPRDGEAAAAFAGHCPVGPVVGSLKGGEAAPNPLTFEGAFWVGASTRGEDADLVRAWRAVCPELTLVLAPREVSRTAALLALHPGAIRRSALRGPVPAGSLVVVDGLGELASILRGAAAAFVGGTFDPVIGGHSPKEAFAAGVPVFHGPEIAHNEADFEGCILVSRDRLAHGLSEALQAAVVPPPSDALPVAVEALRALLAAPAPEVSPRPWAWPLALVQRVKMAQRSRRPPGFSGPTVVTGSANARGCGKTSLARYAAKTLIDQGLQVGIVTRGIGATTPLGDSREDGPDAARLGDEGAALARAGFRVARTAGNLRDCDVVVYEDALHHRPGGVVRLGVIDARFPMARGPFPMGENRGALDADVWIAVNGAGWPVPVGAIPGRFVPGPWVGELPVVRRAFTGTGRAADVFAAIDGLLETRRFPDHHRYSRDDRLELLRWAEGVDLLTTTRDAARLPVGFPCVHRDISLVVSGAPDWWSAFTPATDATRRR